MASWKIPNQWRFIYSREVNEKNGRFSKFDDTPSGTTWDLNGVYPPVTHFDVAFTQHFQIILTGNHGFSTIQYEDNLKSQSQKSKGSKKVHEIGV